jgi:hypothetical protein
MFALWSRRPFWDKTEFVSTGLTALAGALATSLAAFPSAPPGWRAGSASATFLFASATAACKWRAKILDDREKAATRAEIQAFRNRAASQAQRAITRVLDGLRQEFFRVGEEDTPRATLFLCKEAQPEAGLGKHLCIYARAGVYQESAHTWALDDNDITGCRGLAGHVWFVRATISRRATCDWPADGNPREREVYANNLGMTMAEAESLHVKSRTLVGTPIEVNGARWGVLVLDCRKDIRIHASQTSVQRRLLFLAAATISGILGEAEL